jgi:MFS family permease
MTSEVGAAAATGEVSLIDPSGGAPGGQRVRILLYCGGLLLLLQFASPYEALIGLPVTFFLKNKLHLTANAVARFNLIASIPLFVGFVFGMLRDRWSPFRTGDRGLLMLFGVMAAAFYGVVAFMAPSYSLLLFAVILLTSVIQVAWAAGRGLVADIGQQGGMAGQASVIVNMAAVIPNFLAFLFGGALSEALEGGSATLAARLIFLTGAVLMVGVALFGALAPRRIFEAASRETPKLNLIGDLGRIVRHTPIYPALAIYLLWQFAPAGGVALQFHLANALHATDTQVGSFFGVFFVAFVPTIALYGWLCRRFKLRTLLWWGSAGAVLQWTPILFARTPTEALIAAVPIGLMGGVAQAAYVDLAIRSCPKGLQGTMSAMLVACYWFAYRSGDVWGAYIYDHQGGFRMAVFATCAVYALILPLLLLVPKRLTDTADGQALAGT